MQKIRTFIRSFVRSCTSPKYYAEIIKTRFSFSLKYLAVFQFLTTLIVSLFVLVPLAAFDVVGTLNSLKGMYPQDLDISVTNGRLSINKPLPYRIALPAAFRDSAMIDSAVTEENYPTDLQYLVVFESDEYVQGADDVLDQRAVFVLTETTMYIREDDGQGLRVYPIPEGENFTLTPGMVNDGFNKVTGSPFIQNKLYVPLLFAFFFLILLPIMFIGSLIMVAVYGFFVWLMTKILSGPLLAGQVLSYTKAVQVSIHSLTLINVLHFLLRALGEGQLLEGGKFLLAFLVWTGFVLHQSFHMGGRPSAAAAQATVTETTPVASRRVVAKSKGKPSSKSVKTVKKTTKKA